MLQKHSQIYRLEVGLMLQIASIQVVRLNIQELKITGLETYLLIKDFKISIQLLTTITSKQMLSYKHIKMEKNMMLHTMLMILKLYKLILQLRSAYFIIHQIVMMIIFQTHVMLVPLILRMMLIMIGMVMVFVVMLIFVMVVMIMLTKMVMELQISVMKHLVVRLH